MFWYISYLGLFLLELIFGLILGLIVAVLVRKHSSKFNIKETYEWFRDSMKSLLSSAYNTLV